ncbi:MAG: citryl-CoA lyase [Xanthobacteraceae bacterium]|jgi:citrate synthase
MITCKTRTRMSWVKIGKHKDPKSSISAANSEMIVVRGFDLCKDLIGSVSITEHFWLLVTGQRATPSQARVLDACLVAIAEHGLVPSVQAARMTYAAGPEAMQGAVAAGILGCGSVILGSAEQAGRFLAKIYESGGSAAAAKALAQEYRAAKTPFPGYGHPLHTDQDPRAGRLVTVAKEVGVAGPHVAAAYAAEAVIREIMGRPLVLNVSGAIPAVLLDAGFPLGGLKGVPILARAASLIAHLVEEQVRPIGFLLSEAAERSIAYDGPVPANFKPEAH